jgi:hypothetical protein
MLMSHPAGSPPGEALPGWKIICRIAKIMGSQGFDFSCEKDIRDEIATLNEAFIGFSEPSPLNCIPLSFHQPAFHIAQPADLPFPEEHTYMGNRIVDFVPGFRKILAGKSNHV